MCVYHFPLGEFLGHALPHNGLSVQPLHSTGPHLSRTAAEEVALDCSHQEDHWDGIGGVRSSGGVRQA